MEGLAIMLLAILSFFTSIFMFSEEAYVQILTSYLAYITALLMSYISWQYAEVNMIYVSAVLKKFFIILVFVFMMFNMYLFFKFAGWLYRLIVERYVR